MYHSWIIKYQKFCQEVVNLKLSKYRKYSFRVRGKRLENFILSHWKLVFWSKVRVEHGWFDQIPLKAGRNIRGYCDLNGIFTSLKSKICWKLISLKERVERMAVSWGQRQLLDLFLFDQEIWFLSGKSQGILISKVSGNRVIELN